MKSGFPALLLGALFFAGAVQAQNVNIRGDITAFDGKVVSVKTRDGRDVQVELPDNVAVATTRAITLADIKPGSPIAVTTVKRGDDVVAIDVRPLPPTVPHGLSPYDLQPGSTMTNAALEGSVQAAGGQELTLNYKSGTVKVLVPPGTPMSAAAPGSRADIKPGETIYVAGKPAGDNRFIAARVQVSKDGVKPTQ
jgi:hypothetical protein